MSASHEGACVKLLHFDALGFRYGEPQEGGEKTVESTTCLILA
jgi:hypothetical protein